MPNIILYYTFSVSPNGISSQRPWCLNLVHVRLPPGFAANAPTLRPKQIHAASYIDGKRTLIQYYNRMQIFNIYSREFLIVILGTIMMISSAAADNELLWCLTGGMLPVGPGALPRESAALLSLDGPAWALRRAITTSSDFSPSLQKSCKC